MRDWSSPLIHDVAGGYEGGSVTCRKRLNKAGLELRPESTALAVHDLLPLVELCWAWGSGSGFHTRVRAQNPDGPVGRAGWVWGGGGVGRGGVGRVGVGRGRSGEGAEWGEGRRCCPGPPGWVLPAG